MYEGRLEAGHIGKIDDDDKKYNCKMIVSYLLCHTTKCALENLKIVFVDYRVYTLKAQESSSCQGQAG